MHGPRGGIHPPVSYGTLAHTGDPCSHHILLLELTRPGVDLAAMPAFQITLAESGFGEFRVAVHGLEGLAVRQGGAFAAIADVEKVEFGFHGGYLWFRAQDRRNAGQRRIG